MFPKATVTLEDHVATLRDISDEIRLQGRTAVESLWYEYWDTALNFFGLSLARRSQRVTISPQRGISRDALRRAVELPADYAEWSTEVQLGDLEILTEDLSIQDDEETRKPALLEHFVVLVTKGRSPQSILLIVEVKAFDTAANISDLEVAKDEVEDAREQIITQAKFAFDAFREQDRLFIMRAPCDYWQLVEFRREDLVTLPVHKLRDKDVESYAQPTMKDKLFYNSGVYPVLNDDRTDYHPQWKAKMKRILNRLGVEYDSED
ncbi:hypothetical protein BKA93DRAFT_927746 [Sparassis latifolia]